MKKLIFVFALTVGLGCSSANADLLWLKDKPKPVSGLVLRQNASEVEFRYRLEGNEKTIVVERGQISDLIVTIDQGLLEGLEPANLPAYLDYAEELSSFRSDAYAIELSKRLSLIAARWGSSELRQSSFRLLVSLCEGEEQTRVKRLAFIYDATIEIQDRDSESDEANNPDARDATVQIIRLVWKGQAAQARELLGQARFKALIEPVFVKYAKVCRLDDFLAAVNAETLSTNQLGQLLRLQQSLNNGLPPSQAVAQEQSDVWSDVANQVESTGSALPEFESVLPLDPSKRVYRNREWVVR
jgi:hypothetical protein